MAESRTWHVLIRSLSTKVAGQEDFDEVGQYQ